MMRILDNGQSYAFPAQWLHKPYLVRLWRHYRECREYFGAIQAFQCARRLAKAHTT